MNTMVDTALSPSLRRWSPGVFVLVYAAAGGAWLLLWAWLGPRLLAPWPGLGLQAQSVLLLALAVPALALLVHRSNLRVETLRKAHQARHAHLDGIFRTAMDAVVVIDGRQRIVSFNPAAEAMFQRPAEQVLGADLAILIPQDQAATHARQVNAFGRTEAGVRRMGRPGRTVSGRRGDGQQFPLEVSISSFDVDGVLYHTAILRDVSQRQADERERTEALRASQAKSAFVASMSHEMRTPLNAIVGLTQLMRNEPLGAGQLRRLDGIDAAGRHLLSLVSDVLDLSKIEAGRLQLDATDFHLSELFDHVVSVLAEQARAKGLVLDVKLGDAPLWLRGDAQRLRQALLNYASNAVKYSDRGCVTMSVRPLADDGEGVLLRFEVTDQGPGLSAEARQHLFDAYDQAGADATKAAGGTGLGLYLTRRLVHLMGGEVGVGSEQGLGSTFWFTARLERGHGPLPSPADRAHPHAEDELRRCHAGRKVLLAEDNEVNREVIGELLHAAGLAVDLATDGDEATECVARGRYDIILMDMRMPRVDGLAATRAIRALPNGQGVPIVALTANAFADDRAACLAAGMTWFLTKPVHPKVLYGCLLDHLAKASPCDGPGPASAASPAPP